MKLPTRTVLATTTYLGVAELIDVYNHDQGQAEPYCTHFTFYIENIVITLIIYRWLDFCPKYNSNIRFEPI